MQKENAQSFHTFKLVETCQNYCRKILADHVVLLPRLESIFLKKAEQNEINFNLTRNLPRDFLSLQARSVESVKITNLVVLENSAGRTINCDKTASVAI